MRSALLLSALFASAVAFAQEPTWVYTDGPGFEIARPAPTILENDPHVEADGEGRALIRLVGGTYTLELGSAAWSRYTEQDLLAVIDSDRFVAGSNLFISGSGQDPQNAYLGSAVIVERVGTTEQAVSTLTVDGNGWAERAAVSPAGDVWVGVQGYEGFGPSSEPDGVPIGVSIASLSADDLESAPEDWAVTDLPGPQALLALAWTTLGPLAGTDDGLFAESDGVWSRLAFEGEEVFSVAESASGALLASVSGPDVEDGMIYRSMDGGATWTEGAPLPARSVDLLATDNAVLGTAEAAGVFRSVDDGATWASTDMTVSALSLAGQPAGPYYAAGYRATLHRSDDGLTWTPAFYAIDGPLSFTAAPEGMIAQTQRDLYRFDGDSWSYIASPPSRYPSAFSVAPDGAYYLSVVYGQQHDEPGKPLSRLYRSNDAGASWVLLDQIVGTHNELLATDAGTVLVTIPRLGAVLRSGSGGNEPWTTVLSDLGVNSMRQAPSGTIRVASANGYWTSTDDGLTWTEYPFAPGSLRDIFENGDGSLVATRNFGVYLASGDGEPWTPSSHTSIVRGITRNAAGDLFIGASQCGDDMDSTICWSTDGGATWLPYSTASPFSSVQTLAIDEEGVLFVRGPSPAPGQAGTYRTLETTVDAEGGPAALADVTAHPNPVAHSAHLHFSTAQAGRVTVTVYDALGRVVQTLRDADLVAGSYDVRWEANGVASGTYFVRVVTPEDSRTLPLTVVR